MDFKSFLNFERMIIPIIIKVLFWIGLILSAIAGIVVFFVAVTRGISDGGFWAIVLGFLSGLIGAVFAFIVGVLVTRINSELLILVFRINESLTDIKLILEEK